MWLGSDTFGETGRPENTALAIWSHKDLSAGSVMGSRQTPEWSGLRNGCKERTQAQWWSRNSIWSGGKVRDTVLAREDKRSKNGW